MNYQTDEELDANRVAMLRLPLTGIKLRALLIAVKDAYGEGCIVAERPQGWLTISHPQPATKGTAP